MKNIKEVCGNCIIKPVCFKIKNSLLFCMDPCEKMLQFLRDNIDSCGHWDDNTIWYCENDDLFWFKVNDLYKKTTKKKGNRKCLKN